MFASALRKYIKVGVRGYKVSILGASGGIGRPLALLMKLTPTVTELSLFDVVKTPGIGADVTHCSSPAKVSVHTGMEEISNALVGSDVVLIPAGIPIAPGKHCPTPENEHLDFRDALFNTNACIMMRLAEACAKSCPEAMFLIMSNPVNSTVPIFAETLKLHGAYNPRKLFGITALDVCRANTFVAANQGLDVLKTKVTVIGGHAGHTILPLLSQVPNAKFTPEDIATVTHQVQHGGEVVVKAKEGTGSATLSMAFACHTFTSHLLEAMAGKPNVVECAFVENNLTPAPFFSTPLRLGPRGVEEVLPYGKLSPFEQKILDDMIPDLIEHAEKGVNFVKYATAAAAAAKASE